jgi:hypothetical protein
MDRVELLKRGYPLTAAWVTAGFDARLFRDASFLTWAGRFRFGYRNARIDKTES